jgi:PPK2 family polyphosphate:nucleotide phosphotransferase
VTETSTFSMDQYRVLPGSEIDLSLWDPADLRASPGSKSKAKALLRELNEELEVLQELLYAEGKHRVLIVLQGMDTSGKDGTIRHVFEGVNPQGVRVANFKVPTHHELARDYLWRVHQVVPRKGEIVIFNRSHYEDVLVVRVHSLVPEDIWSRRYDHINDFERMMHDEGTVILKFYLHINMDEQKERLLARLHEPQKQWKFNLGDVKERQRWPDYTQAYEAVLSRTSTDWAPWYVVPANRKWYRNLVVASTLVDTLKGLNMQYPEPEEGLDSVVFE